MRVELLGIPGSGKTTLAQAMGRAGYIPLHEDPSRCAHWGEPDVTALSGQLAYELEFLIQHLYLVNSNAVHGPDTTPAVADWSFITDKLWASLRLHNTYDYYLQIYETLIGKHATAKFYIYIREDPERACRRLQKRDGPRGTPDYGSLCQAAQSIDDVIPEIPRDRLAILDGDETYTAIKDSIVLREC